MQFYLFFVVKFFGEENAQRFFINRFAEAVANEEAQQGKADAKHNLVQVENLDLKEHGQAVDDYATAHGCNSAVFVGLGPEKTENQYPEEGCFQTAEGKHVNLPDNAWRFDGDSINQKAEDNCRTKAVETNLIIAELFFALALDVHVNVFDDRGGRGKQQRGDGGNGCCNRSDDNDAGPEGGEALHDGNRHDVIHAVAVGCNRSGKNAFADDTDPGCDQCHGANNDGTDNHSIVQRLGILVADAADNGLRQRQCTYADEQPLADVKRNRHLAAGKRLQHIGVLGADVAHDFVEAAACMHHTAHEDAQADDHGNGAAGVGNGNALEAADSGVNDNNQAKHREAGEVGKTGYCFEELGSADELCHHSGAEEGDNDNGRHVRQKIGMIAGTQYVDYSYGINLTRNEGNFFAEHAQDEEDNDYLYDGHVQPAIADNPGYARTANEGAYAAVGGSGGHSQYEAAESTAADEVILGEILLPVFF